MKVTVVSVVMGALSKVRESLEKKKTGRIGNQRKNRNYSDHSNVKIG